MADFPRSLIEFQRRFPDERACAAYLARVRWPDGFRCPSCGHGKGWELSTKAFTWECASCRRQTSVTASTVMHASKLPLTVWFWAAYLMATHSNGIAALQLQAQLGLGSYKSAWLLAAKLRRAMVAPGRAPLAGLVEVDETVIPLRRKDEPPASGHGRSHQGKMLVAAGVEVHDGGPDRVRLGAIQDASAESLHAFVGAHVETGATARTDGWSGYPGAPGITHEPHVVGPMAAHVVLPWTHRVFATSNAGHSASITVFAASTCNPLSTNSPFASTAATPGTPPSAPSSASPSPHCPPLYCTTVVRQAAASFISCGLIHGWLLVGPDLSRRPVAMAGDQPVGIVPGGEIQQRQA